MNKLLKTRNAVLAVLALLAAAGLVLYLVAGFAPGARFDGVKRYSAVISAENFDPDALDVRQLERELRAALGSRVGVTLEHNYTSGAYELCVSVSPASYALLIEDASAVLSEKYAALSLGEFTERTYAAAQDGAAVAGLLLVAVILWALGYLAAGIAVGFVPALSILLLAVLNSLAVFAVYGIARLDCFPALVAALAAVVAATVFYGAPNLAAYDRALRAQGKRDAAAACASVHSGERALGTLVLAVVLVAAFLAASVSLQVRTIWPVGLLVGAALILALVSTGLALPGMWAAQNRK